MEQKQIKNQQKEDQRQEQHSSVEQGIQPVAKRRKVNTEAGKIKTTFQVPLKIRNLQSSSTYQMEERFDDQQIPLLLAGLKVIQQYYRMVSREIKHQEDSISTLEPAITQRFTQLANRKQLMVQKGKQNIKFIRLILKPYHKLLVTNMMKEHVSESIMSSSEKEIPFGHHSHQNFGYQIMNNLFCKVALQWGQSGSVHYVRRAIELLEKYRIWHSSQKSQKGQKGQNSQSSQSSILVVNCGMGRILSEIRQIFPKTQTSLLLQGHFSELQDYICSQHFLNSCNEQTSIFPYIHNFTNYLKQSSPYRQIVVPYRLKDYSNYFPMTWGKFSQLYRTHIEQWHCLVTIYNNYQIQDVIAYIKMVYNMLTPEGIWIDLCTSSFSRNAIMLSYREYEEILDRSQFKLLQKGSSSDYWYQDKECIMNEKRRTYYRVMQK